MSLPGVQVKVTLEKELGAFLLVPSAVDVYQQFKKDWLDIVESLGRDFALFLFSVRWLFISASIISLFLMGLVRLLISCYVSVY